MILSFFLKKRDYCILCRGLNRESASPFRGFCTGIRWWWKGFTKEETDRAMLYLYPSIELESDELPPSICGWCGMRNQIQQVINYDFPCTGILG